MALVIGCSGDGDGSGSGVDPTLPLGTLATGDVNAVCSYAASLSRTVDCDGNPVESTTDAGDCADLVGDLLETCDATVGDLETCFEDLAAQSDDEVCALELPPSCDFFGDLDCVGTQSIQHATTWAAS